MEKTETFKKPLSFEDNVDKIKERFENFSCKPKCTERLLGTMQFLILLKLKPDNQISLSDFKYLLGLNNEQRKEDYDAIEETSFKNVIDDLSSFIMIEFPLALRKNLLSEIRSIDLKFQNGNFQSAFNDGNQIYKTICPLNIDLISTYARQVEGAGKELKDKEIVVILGGTGVGKSTLIHYLCGSNFEETTEKGLYHIRPISFGNPQLGKVVCSPFFRSETRYITPITVEDISTLGASRHEPLIIVDTPGFRDTNSQEINITNGYGIIKGICQAKKVKLALLVSGKSLEGSRAGALDDDIKSVISMLSDPFQDIDKIYFIFNNFKSKEEIEIKIEHYWKERDSTTNQKDDNNFKELICSLKEQSEVDNQIFIEPLEEDKRRIILNKLSGKKKGFFNPQLYFQYELPSESLKLINDFLQVNTDSIEELLKSSNFKIISYKLHQIKRLSDLLDNKTTISDAFLSITRRIVEYFELEESQILRQLSFLPNDLSPEMVDEILSNLRSIIQKRSNPDFTEINKNLLDSNVSDYSRFELEVEKTLDCIIKAGKFDKKNAYLQL